MKLTSSFQAVISLLLLGQNNIETQSIISKASPNISGSGALFSQWIDDSNAASYQTVPRFWSNTVATSPKDHGVGSRSAGRAPFGTGFPDDSQGNKDYGETGILPPEDGDTKSLLNTLRKTSNSFAIADNSSTPTPRANSAEEQASREQDSPKGKMVPDNTGIPTWEYLGFNHTSWWSGDFAEAESAEALAQIESVGADTAAIVATHYLNDQKSHEILATQKTEPLSCVAQAVADAKAIDLQVWLKPHLDLSNGAWRGFLDPANRPLFFQNYKTWILAYAQLAQQENVEVLVIGTEIDKLIGEADKSAWLDIIAAVRQVYSGKLTYAVNWDKPGAISFASELDFIGIDAYYPLTENSNATVEQLVQAWTSPPEVDAVNQLPGGRSIVNWLAQISQTLDKPIVFAEIGYRSVDGHAAQPYAWSEAGDIDLEEQARLYEAFFRVFGGFEPSVGDMSWFEGAQFWNWYARAEPNDDPTDTDYAILHKPAQDIIQTYAPHLLEGEPFSTAPNYTKDFDPNDIISGWNVDDMSPGMAGDDDFAEWGLERLDGGPSRDTLTGSLSKNPLVIGTTEDVLCSTGKGSIDPPINQHVGNHWLDELKIFSSTHFPEPDADRLANREPFPSRENDVRPGLGSTGKGSVLEKAVDMQATQLSPLIGLPDFTAVNV